MKIFGLATQGNGTDDEARLKALLTRFDAEFLNFDRSHKFHSFFDSLRKIQKEKPDLLLLEGTGIGGGLAALISKWAFGTKYVVSSGDAIAPFVSAIVPALGPLFSVYERLLCKNSAGFVGWSPYLAGRALGFGAKRAMTAAGWSPFHLSTEERSQARLKIRQQFSIPDSDIVVGIVGSLAWNPRVRYAYGAELVRAFKLLKRRDVRIMIVGDGPGIEKLGAEMSTIAETDLADKSHVVFTGRVPRAEVPSYLAAMDIASLPQSLDAVGSFRYTTKLSEYLAARLPIITGQLPLSYDLPGDWLWRIKGETPWDKTYIQALSDLLERITREEILKKAQGIPQHLHEFDEKEQIERLTHFLEDILSK